ncbi:MAG: guanylate kinase [Bacteroidales bacterium]|nr:guanylate kinase [Bacteroidales bacterium]
MSGKLIVVSAPSGSGKTSIVKELLTSGLGLEFSISACSRKPRINEVHAKDYYFLSADDFRNKIKKDAFIEWEEVYPGNFYGTLKSEVKRIWEKGNHVIFDVDVVGGLNIKKQFPDKCLAIFIKAPSVAELEKRLRGRSTDNEETILKRIEKAEHELSFAPRFDEIIVNDDFKSAVKLTYSKIRNFIQKAND